MEIEKTFIKLEINENQQLIDFISKQEILKGLEFKESMLKSQKSKGILLIYYLLEYYSSFYENEYSTEDFYGIQFLYLLPI